MHRDAPCTRINIAQSSRIFYAKRPLSLSTYWGCLPLKATIQMTSWSSAATKTVFAAKIKLQAGVHLHNTQARAVAKNGYILKSIEIFNTTAFAPSQDTIGASRVERTAQRSRCTNAGGGYRCNTSKHCRCWYLLIVVVLYNDYRGREAQ